MDCLEKLVNGLQQYSPGDIVWAKIPRYPWWPAKVVSKEESPTLYLGNKEVVLIKFLNEENFERITEESNIKIFDCAEKDKYIRKGSQRTSDKLLFDSAVAIAEEIQRPQSADSTNENTRKIVSDQKERHDDCIKQSRKRTNSDSGNTGLPHRGETACKKLNMDSSQLDNSDHNLNGNLIEECENFEQPELRNSVTESSYVSKNENSSKVCRKRKCNSVGQDEVKCKKNKVDKRQFTKFLSDSDILKNGRKRKKKESLSEKLEEINLFQKEKREISDAEYLSIPIDNHSNQISTELDKKILNVSSDKNVNFKSKSKQSRKGVKKSEPSQGNTDNSIKTCAIGKKLSQNSSKKIIKKSAKLKSDCSKNPTKNHRRGRNRSQDLESVGENSNELDELPPLVVSTPKSVVKQNDKISLIKKLKNKKREQVTNPISGQKIRKKASEKLTNGLSGHMFSESKKNSEISSSQKFSKVNGATGRKTIKAANHRQKQRLKTNGECLDETWDLPTPDFERTVALSKRSSDSNSLLFDPNLLKDSCDSDDSESDMEFPEGLSPIVGVYPIAEKDIIWVHWQKGPFWPAYVRKLYRKKKRITKISIVFIGYRDETPSVITLSFNPKKMLPFVHRDKDQFINGGKSQEDQYSKQRFVEAVDLAEAYLYKKALGKLETENLAFFFENYDEDNMVNIEPYEPESSFCSSPIDVDKYVPLNNKAVSIENGMSKREQERQKRLKKKQEGLISFIVSDEMKEYLLDIHSGRKQSERREKFYSSRTKVRQSIRHAGFGPIADEEQQEEIITTLLAWLTEANTPGEKLLPDIDYLLDVWIPEAIVYALIRIKKYNRSKAWEQFDKGVRMSKEEMNQMHLSMIEGARSMSAEDRINHAEKVEDRLRAAGISPYPFLVSRPPNLSRPF